MDFDEEADRFEKRPVRTTVKWGILAMLGIAALLVVGFLIFRPLNTITGVANRTLNPDNVIYNYEYFHQQCQDIFSIRQRIQNAEANMAAYAATMTTPASFLQQQEFNRLNGLVLGLQNNRENMIAEYNARAAMMNRRIFNEVGTLAECEAQARN